MKTRVLLINIILLSSFLLLAKNENSVKEKISEIEGTVNEIVIKTENSETVFKGSEAEEVFKMLNSKRIEKHIEWISEDDFDGDEHVIIFKSDEGTEHIVKKGKPSKTIKIEVEEENDSRNVTVTTIDEGDKKIETYEGKEAEEYLEKIHKEYEITIEIDEDIDNTDDIDIILHKTKHDVKRIEKNVKVELVDGIKEVTVKTIKDGKETIKKLSGKEAEEYLKNEPNDVDKIKIIKKKKEKK